MANTCRIPIGQFGSPYSAIPIAPAGQRTGPGPEAAAPGRRRGEVVVEGTVPRLEVDEGGGVWITQGAKKIESRMSGRDQDLVTNSLEEWGIVLVMQAQEGRNGGKKQ